MTDKRYVTVRFIYRTKTDEGLEKNVMMASVLIGEGENIVWSDQALNPFVISHIEFMAPDWNFDLREAKRQGVEEFKEELRELSVQALGEKLKEILYDYDRDTYEYD